MDCFYNTTITVTFAASLTGIAHIFGNIFLYNRDRNIRSKDLRNTINSYLNSDIDTYELLKKNYEGDTFIKIRSYEYIQTLLANSFNLSSLKNDMYLLKDLKSRARIYNYYVTKDYLLKDLQYYLETIYNQENKGTYKNDLDKELGKKFSGLSSIIQEAKDLQKL